ncbi:MAG: DUF3298/DUF4163 domain-containing protein [Sphingobacteriia bacterium]|nr:DUF3298/DUF4163 domain-containing protein [Sphingobacteriia bacterium]
MVNNNVQVEKITIQDEMYHKNNLLLNYKIVYPQFRSEKFSTAVNRMNPFYKKQALDFERYCKKNLFDMAIAQYEDSVAHGYPVRTFEALLTFKITYNQDCTISLYFDRYEFTGGAHGSTIRYSNTWNLQYAGPVTLRQMFPRGVDYKNYLIQSIDYQIARKIKNGENIYFEDYEKNVEKYFKTNKFYLTKLGMVIYFQQYEIAPYSSGIVEFMIPYSAGGVQQPRCM